MQLPLAELSLPESHPRYGEACHVFGYALSHPRGIVLVDSGVGAGHALIDELYHPRSTPLDAALARAELPRDEVYALVNTHLHFDHCGGNRLFPHVPIFVQRAEWEAAHEPSYTGPEWLDFAGSDYQLLDGESEILPGLHIIPSPGHTPGHQSVLLDTPTGRELVVGQAAYTAAEFEQTRTTPAPIDEGTWSAEAYAASLHRLQNLDASRAYFSHDREIWGQA